MDNQDAFRYIPATGTWEQDEPDGSVLIHHEDPRAVSEEKPDGSEHDANLVESLSPATLSSMASDLIEAIEADNASRASWLTKRSKAFAALGLETENPRSDITSSSTVDGLSTVRHPMLLEASERFRSNALGELLPASGPLKVQDNALSSSERDTAAVALEKAGNVYLTDVATEYYPDTDLMLFGVGWGGAGIKKGYHCPIRRRPVIEAVDAKDIIVSNNATDFDNAPRITHVIPMDQQTMRLMQKAGAYADVPLSPPDEESTDLDRKIATSQGIEKGSARPQDINHTVWECHTTYDIPEFSDDHDGLPVPYKIVIEKTSQKILEIRRNWPEGKPATVKRRTFVLYSFAPMFGLWPYGLYHFLGNTTQAMTAAWRLVLDNGMFCNFPMWLYAKGATNNETPNFRAGPGQGVPVDCPGGKLSDNIMSVPYKPTDPAFIAFIGNMEAQAQRLGGTAEAQVGEGNQMAPVGTTLAMIDQAQKIMSAVHKRCHRAQKLELAMLRDLLREDPEALWRHRPDDKVPENAEQIIAALNDYDFSPVSDPNTPTHMHRLMKMMGVMQRADLHPDAYDLPTVEKEGLRVLGWDNPEQFLKKQLPPGTPMPAPPPDPHAIRAMTTLAIAKEKGGQSMQIATMKNQNDAANRALKAEDIASRERQTAAKIEFERQNKVLDITHSLAIHPASLDAINSSVTGEPRQ